MQQANSKLRAGLSARACVVEFEDTLSDSTNTQCSVNQGIRACDSVRPPHQTTQQANADSAVLTCWAPGIAPTGSTLSTKRSLVALSGRSSDAPDAVC